VIGRQFLRYAVTGLLLNVALYGAYLALTRSLMTSPAAMTLTYCTGVLLGFLANRSFTFQHRGGQTPALLRYIAAYVLGWAVDYACLYVLVWRNGIPHEAVQGGLTLALPLLLFLLQKYWVFPSRPARTRAC
jgi:putative flippase GtrA